MSAIDYNKAYINIKSFIMNDWGYTESDMDDEEIENKVNRKAGEIFHFVFEFDYDELND